MTTAVIAHQRQQLQNPEDVSRRYRAYMRDCQPLIDALVRIHSAAMPTICLIVHSDGSQTDMRGSPDDWLDDAQRLQVKFLRDQITALAKSYGLYVPPDSP